MSLRLRVFHSIVVLGAAATVILSWPLWQSRVDPPLLPLVSLPAVGTGFLLLAALTLAVARPAAGAAAYGAALAYAIATDWTRLQPAMVSFGLLMTVALPGPAGLAIARAHLVSLWLYAGLHKLVSPEFMAYRGDVSMLRGLFAQPPAWLGAIYPEMVVVAEVGLAAAAILPATRRVAAVWALLLHAAILLSLSPSGRNWNPSVWAWNVVLGLAGFFLIAPWKKRVREYVGAQPVWARGAMLFLIVVPALSQIGVGDPYLAHHLYSRSTPISYVCRSDSVPPPRPGLGEGFASNDGQYCRFIDYFPWLGVPEPGAHAFVRRYFAETCVAGDRLLIRERRWVFLARGREWARAECGA